MAATLTSTLSVRLQSILANAVGLATVSGSIDIGGPNAVASGTGANQADKVFSESQKSIVAAYDVDLAGVLLDIFGGVITFARVKTLVVIASAANTGNVIVGAAAANAFFGFFGLATHTVNVRPGGLLVLHAPDATAWPVTAATADILRFAPSAGTQVFDWAVLGASV